MIDCFCVFVGSPDRLLLYNLSDLLPSCSKEPTSRRYAIIYPSHTNSVGTNNNIIDDLII